MTTGPSAPTPPEPPTREASRMMVLTFVGAAITTVVVAIVLAVAVEPWLIAIALFALVDLWLARAYATGRLRVAADPRLGRPEQGGVVAGPGPGPGPGVTEGDAAGAADRAAADPSYNPYARED